VESDAGWQAKTAAQNVGLIERAAMALFLNSSNS
jgi:hypothetical protein